MLIAAATMTAPRNQAKKRPPENKPSALLSKEENDLVFSLLGKSCTTLATAVVQVFMTEPPSHTQWIKQFCGVVCFVKDNPRRSYFIRLFDIDRKATVWEQELYIQFEYKTPRPFFHTFEADNCQAGLNFADDGEAVSFRGVVEGKLRHRQQRRQERKRAQNAIQPTRTGITVNAQSGISESTSNVHEKSKDKQKKSKKLTKADISLPMNFVHIQHIGWNPNTGFDCSKPENLDSNLKEFFKVAGVSDKDLADTETRNFIYDFLDQHGGIDAAIREVKKPSPPPPVPPPVPSREAPTPTPSRHSAPPLPPTRSAAPPPPPPPPVPPNVPRVPLKIPSSSLTPSPVSTPVSAVNRIPPPPPNRITHIPPAAPKPQLPPQVVPPPPPPPPPPACSVDGGTSTTAGLPEVSDPRSALLEQIRRGTTLQHVEMNGESDKASYSSSSSSSSDARGALLSQIRQGIELKPVAESKPTQVSPSMEGLAGALARALQERSRAIHQTDDSDSDNEDEDDDDDEWED